jgi:hypothetical protein
MAKFANTKGLSKQEKYMIQGMLIEDNSIEDIAKYLDREVELVNGFVQDLPANWMNLELVESVNEELTTEESNTQKPNTMMHFINKTGKGNKGVTIMTPVASERADANRSGRGIHTVKNSTYTHKIK